MITFIRNGDLPYELSYETADVNEICNMEKPYHLIGSQKTAVMSQKHLYSMQDH